MPLIETATTYVLDALLQNEEFKKFPQEFITESVRWVRSWFLTDDPKTEAKLTSDKSKDYKAGVVESKLEDLLENPQFKRELEAKLTEYERHAAAVSSISNRTATIENSQISTGGGSIHQAGGNIHIVHNYAPPPTGESVKPVVPFTKPTVSAGEKESLRRLVGANETKTVIGRLDALSLGHEEFRKMVLVQSAKWDALRREEMLGISSRSDIALERNNIVLALLDLIDELG